MRERTAVQPSRPPPPTPPSPGLEENTGVKERAEGKEREGSKKTRERAKSETLMEGSGNEGSKSNLRKE